MQNADSWDAEYPRLGSKPASPVRIVRFPIQKDPRLTRAYKRLLDAGGRVLRVVYMKTGSDTLIITAFLDRDAE
jgi:hypothetical protein